MELHPNALVLLSNAPALPENAVGLPSTPTNLAETQPPEICKSYNRGDDCSACSLPHVCLRCKQRGHPATDCKYGILRPSSGNVGSSLYQPRIIDLKTGDTQKYGFRPVSSLVNPPHNSAQAAIKAEHPRRQQHSPWSSPKGLLYWHVEFQTPRYQAYRAKCREKGSKAEIWPDRVEEAFQIAIRLFQRRGRKKRELHGKQSGGNEFIADYIYKRTGVTRVRKQVSSHLQVLKAFLGENKLWMSLVADIKAENSNKKAHSSTAHEETAGDYGDLEYDDASEYQPSQASYRRVSNGPPAPIEILTSNMYPGPTIRRVLEFAMTLTECDSEAPLHSYTSLQSEMASAPKTLADVKNWREMYPPLAADYDRGQIECPIFLFDTHLSLMDHYHPSSLAIKLSLHFSQGAHFTEWRSYPRFYEQNGCPVDLTEFSEPSADNLDSSQVEGTDDAKLGQIAFRGRWWAWVFSSMIIRKSMMDNIGDPKLIREEGERAIERIQGISVMQEIWATHRVYNHRPQRMAILLWKFSTAKSGQAATTSWRRLNAPLSAYEIQSPHPTAEKPPMTLDTTLQAASPYDAHYTAQPSIFSAYPTEDLIPAPLSEDSSPSTTPTPESHSFPSSTSTLLPSSVSNSIYPLYPSQESSFQSQDSAYPTLGSLDSQNSEYSLYQHHDIVEASHESYGHPEFADGSQECYGSQEVMYHSQESLYQEASELYEYPYQMVDAPVTASTSQDFTGGQIHLSYAQTEDSQSSYEAPLIAPQANMMPQHQLIQHPEQFNQHDYLDQHPDDLGGGHHELDEQAQSLPQPYELNELTIDYNGWEETLRLNPDLERHLSINAVDEVRDIGQEYMSRVGQETLELKQGEVLGEVQDEEGSPGRQLEYQ